MYYKRGTIVFSHVYQCALNLRLACFSHAAERTIFVFLPSEVLIFIIMDMIKIMFSLKWTHYF